LADAAPDLLCSRLAGNLGRRRGKELQMAMDDDDAPKPKSFQPRNLEPLSIAELNDYIGELETEIGRARQAIAAKTNQRGAADSIFRT
jgi:uncharacterized small protein (DUF1192 family)